MDLGARLQTVAGMVYPGRLVADIGSDHAYLPIALVLQRICPQAIAADKNEGPCQSARRFIARYGLCDQIDVRCGDGLAVLQPGEATTIVLAGMGGRLICDILQNALITARSAERLVMQPQKDCASLRTFLAENGWQIDLEQVAQENGFFYPVIAAVRGKMSLSPLEVKYGPYLMHERPPSFIQMLQHRRSEIRRLLELLAKESGESAAERRAVLQEEEQELAIIMRNDRFDNKNKPKGCGYAENIVCASAAGSFGGSDQHGTDEFVGV